MSHISVVKNKIKFDNDQDLINALNMMKNQFPGLTYQKSSDGKTIQVKYAAIDDPVKRYHPDGNLRFVKKNGEWEMSGDSFNCGKTFKAVTDAVKVNYQKSGVNLFNTVNGYTSSETKDNEGNVVVIARKW